MNNIKKAVEGYVITVFGIAVIVSSVFLPDNPVKIDGFTGFVAQARFFPLISGIGIAALGVKLIFLMVQNKDEKLFKYNITKEELKPLSITIVMVGLLLLGVSDVGFIPSILVFFILSIGYFNYKTMKSIVMIVTIAAFFIITGYAVPMMLNIRMP